MTPELLKLCTKGLFFIHVICEAAHKAILVSDAKWPFVLQLVRNLIPA